MLKIVSTVKHVTLKITGTISFICLPIVVNIQNDVNTLSAWSNQTYLSYFSAKISIGFALKVAVAQLMTGCSVCNHKYYQHQCYVIFICIGKLSKSIHKLAWNLIDFAIGIHVLVLAILFPLI